MKKFLLLFLVTSLSVGASAQRRHNSRNRNSDEPTVYIISVKETDTIYRNNPNYDPMFAQQRLAEQKNAVVRSAIQDHRETTRTGFQQVSAPSVIFANSRNTFSFAIGGYVNMRLAYGFNSTIDNIDVVPYDIPMSLNYATKQKLEMDATTSRIYFRGIANSRCLGRVVIFFDADFRGGRQGSYTPRLRSGYVSFLGLTIGRDITTFCDLTAAPRTIDFQGPNAYNFNFATVLRYEIPFAHDHLKFGVAAEMPHVSGTYGTTFDPIPQRVPDFPVYLQVAWGKNRQSHIRASAVFRDMYLHSDTSNKNIALFGWGVQASGNIHIGRVFQLFFNGVYGEGITPYIQDLTGSGLDFTPNPSKDTSIQTMPMYGWQAAAQINLWRNVAISGGYSAVTICKRHGYYSQDEYRMGQYIFGNIFCNVTKRFQIAAEYLWASRKNVDGLKHHGQRVNFMMQYSF